MRHGVVSKMHAIYMFSTASRTALGPTQLHIQWISGALSVGVKRPGREADHSPPSSAEVKEFVAWCLVEHRGQLYAIFMRVGS
jgi:hypothetical protein